MAISVSELGLEMVVREVDPKYGPHMEFGYGTVRGLFRIDGSHAAGIAFVVNTVVNDNRGNGHFKEWMKHMHAMCSDQKMALVFEAVGLSQRAGLEEGDPRRFALHLKKRGYRNIGGTDDWYLPPRKMNP